MSDLLVLDQVRKSFESLRAVDGVSLVVPQGKIVGLIGPNGSGKSTLFNVICGLERADSGRILFDDQDIARLGAPHIFGRGLARSFQDPALFFRMTVLDNVLLAEKGQRGENPLLAPFRRAWLTQEEKMATTASGVLDEVQLRGHYAQLALELSGGQMKLLDIGRSLITSPRLLLLDEPTAGVAPKLARAIFDEIARMRETRNLTFFIIEHRLEILFDFVDSVYVMHNGRIIAHGTPAEVAADAQVREVYFGD